MNLVSQSKRAIAENEVLSVKSERSKSFIEDEVIESQLKKKKKQLRTITGSIPAHNCISWDVHLNPNITEITSIQEAPFQLFFLARPSGQGKHTPILVYATEQTLIELDALERVEKIEQQKRRRILEKMANALIDFGPLPLTLKTILEKTSWGAAIVGKLNFIEQNVQ